MQLTGTHRRGALRALGALLLAAALLALARPARAQVLTLDTTHSVYYEKPARTEMFVYTPSVTAGVSPTDWLTVTGGWEADVVSGASVSIKAGPAYKATQPVADVISTASVHDFRNVGKGNFTIKKDNTSFGGGYVYSTENDYQSNSFNVTARTELFEHNTQLQIDFAHNFDSVCDLVQNPNSLPALRLALPSSKGCFTSDATRTTHDVAIDSLQGSWSQAWTPTFQTQAVYTMQIANGFQSDPYRSIVLGQGLKAQEHDPSNRTRHAVALRGNFYVRPLKGAIRIGVRGYWDTWNILSGAVDAEYEQYLGDALRVGVAGRIYKQTGAVFWSDDYTGGDPPLGPKGQYFTGDRELSPFWSGLVGLRLTYAFASTQKSLVKELKAIANGDILFFNYEDYTLGGDPVTGARAYLLTLGISAGF